MPDKRIKVVALGDSITYGFPYTPQESWVSIASDLLDIDIINEGCCGDTTSFMLYRFFESVAHYYPTHVIIMGGVNDAFWRISASKVDENIVKMCIQAEELGAVPVIGLPTPVNEIPFENILTVYRERMERYADSQGYKIIDFYRALLDPERGGVKWGCHVDGVHPSLEGYEEMSMAVKRHHFE